MTDKTEMPEDKKKALDWVERAQKLMMKHLMQYPETVSLVSDRMEITEIIRTSLQTPSYMEVADKLAKSLMMNLSVLNLAKEVMPHARTHIEQKLKDSTEALDLYNKIKQEGV